MKQIIPALTAAAAIAAFAFSPSVASARSSYSIGISTGPAFYPGPYPGFYPGPVFVGRPVCGYPAPYPYYRPYPVWGGGPSLSFSYHHR